MQLTVLVDNNTLTDRYFLAEPGLSFHIVTKGMRILFDAGYSDVLLRNAWKMGIDLSRLDTVVLSHSHLDHTWGLEPLFRLFNEAIIERGTVLRLELVAHPEVFLTRGIGNGPEIGQILRQEAVERFCTVHLTREPLWLTERLVFLGEIPRLHEFEKAPPVGVVRGPEGPKDCPCLDDSALAWVSERGLVIVTGCSHSGICNIVSHAREVCGEERIADIVGGLHLLDAPLERLERTARFLVDMGVERLHPCHCTGLRAKTFLAQSLDVEEVGVGLRLEY